jgi:hypothetical protein
MGNKQAVSVP